MFDIRRDWWKLMGCIILLYVFIAGFLVPLKPGITGVSPNRLVAGTKVILDINGYNTNFKSEENFTTAFLKLDSIHFLKAEGFQAMNESNCRINFNLPRYLPTNSKIGVATLVIQNPEDGLAILPDGIFIRQDSVDVDAGNMAWTKSNFSAVPPIDKFRFPFRNILVETVRNTFFHTAIWFAMFALLFVSVWHSFRYLRNSNFDHDLRSSSYTSVALLFGVLGTVTGSIWARFTWGTYWTDDVKLNMTVIVLLIYLAYFILRQSIGDQDRRARIAAAYNIFAFVAMLVLLFVIPRLSDSLHPGNGGNPAMGGEDLDHTLRMIFYPAIIGLSIIGLWMGQLYYRFEKLKLIQLEKY